VHNKSVLSMKFDSSVYSVSTVFGSGVPRGVWGGSNPSPPEIPKAILNRAKLNPIVKNVKTY